MVNAAKKSVETRMLTALDPATSPGRLEHIGGSSSTNSKVLAVDSVRPTRRTLKTLKTPNRSGYEGFEGDRAVRRALAKCRVSRRRAVKAASNTEPKGS